MCVRTLALRACARKCYAPRVTNARRSAVVSDSAKSGAFQIVEATIPDMQAAMKDGRLTSREIVTRYLVRLATYEHRLHAALAVNPRALDEADQLDRERAQGSRRGCG